MSIGLNDIPVAAHLLFPVAANMDGGYGDTLEPPTQIGGSDVTGITISAGTYNFTLSPTLADGYVVFRRAGVTTGSPTVVDGVVYAANDPDSSGNWTCVEYVNFDDSGISSSSQTTVDSGLVPGTAYRVVIYSFNGQIPVYNTTVTEGENAENFTTNVPAIGLFRRRRKDFRGRFIVEQTYTATGTTDGSGDLTMYAPSETGRFLSGSLIAIHFDADAGTLATGSDITITSEKTGQAILSASNIGTSDVIYKPRTQSQDTTGTAVAGIYEPVTLSKDRIKVVIAQGGASKVGVFRFTMV